MERIQNRESTKFFIMLAVVFAVVMVASNVAQTVLVRTQRQADIQVFATFLGNISAQYPEVKEEEWVALMNETGNREVGTKMLRSYGLIEGQEGFRRQERYFLDVQVLLNVALALLFLMSGLLFFGYIQKRRRRLEELTGYLRKVAHGEYMLELEKQGEDELSFLQNELYKVIVLLREQAELMKEQRIALAQSVSDISHQLKTPLTSVMVLVDNLMENGDMEETTRRHFLAEITSQLSGMAWLVAVMLKLARFDAGVVELERKEVPVEQLLKQVLEGLEQQAEWREVSLRLVPSGRTDPGQAEWERDVQEDRETAEHRSSVRESSQGDRETAEHRQPEITLWGDAKWLKEALSNIVKNAIEHSPAKERVCVSVQDNAVYTEIRIQNFGTPIDEEDQKHIFERFYQSKNAAGAAAHTRAGMENAGIGLALAKEIIERQNGLIFVESDEEKGTVFTVKFLKM